MYQGVSGGVYSSQDNRIGLKKRVEDDGNQTYMESPAWTGAWAGTDAPS